MIYANWEELWTVYARENGLDEDMPDESLEIEVIEYLSDPERLRDRA